MTSGKTTSSKKLAKAKKRHTRAMMATHSERGAAQRVAMNPTVRFERALRTHSLTHVVISEFEKIPEFPVYAALLHRVAHRMIEVRGEKCRSDATFLSLSRELQTGELYLRHRLGRHNRCVGCLLREAHAIAEHRKIVDFDLVEALVQGPRNRDAHGKHTGKAAHPAWVVARTVVRRAHALLEEEEVSQEFVAQLFQSENVEHTAKILRAFRLTGKE